MIGVLIVGVIVGIALVGNVVISVAESKTTRHAGKPLNNYYYSEDPKADVTWLIKSHPYASGATRPLALSPEQVRQLQRVLGEKEV